MIIRSLPLPKLTLYSKSLLLAGQSLDTSSGLSLSYKQSQKEDGEPKPQAAESLISLSSSTSSSSSGVHKQKSFDFVEIATAEDPHAENATSTIQSGNITAYREVS